MSRLFSERDFEISDGDGNVIGHARTVWAVIDTRTRQVGDISRIEWVSELIPDRECPVAKPSRLRPVEPPAEPSDDYREARYRFQYTDIDFNRHVNTMRYIEMMLDVLPIERFAEERPLRLDINFLKEARYGQTLSVALEERGSQTLVEIRSDAGAALCRGAFEWR